MRKNPFELPESHSHAARIAEIKARFLKEEATRQSQDMLEKGVASAKRVLKEHGTIPEVNDPAFVEAEATTVSHLSVVEPVIDLPEESPTLRLVHSAEKVQPEGGSPGEIGGTGRVAG